VYSSVCECVILFDNLMLVVSFYMCVVLVCVLFLLHVGFEQLCTLKTAALAKLCEWSTQDVFFLVE
jgi:hypothetical protein